MWIHEIDVNIYGFAGDNFDFYSVSKNEAFRFINPNGTDVGITEILIGSQELLNSGSVFGGNGADDIAGTPEDDVIFTGDGNDTITSGLGNDSLYGDLGNDLLNAGAGSDNVQAGKGDDIVTYIHSENVNASDRYFGNQGDDHLDLYFGSGDLTSAVKSSLVAYRNFLGNASNIDENANGGAAFNFTGFNLSVSRFETFTLHVNNVATQIDVDAKNDMFFGSVNVPITGNLLADNGFGVDESFLGVVLANAGTFTTAQGGTLVISSNGNITYTPPNGFSGTDSYTYTAHDGQGTTGTATAQFGVGLPGVVAGTSGGETLNGTSGADTMYGLAGNDTLNGNDGNDTLIGGPGIDTMAGGLGDDIYILEGSDVIIEAASAGTDTVRSAASGYTLTANVENLTLTGTANINATGNTMVNILTGNSGNNILNGGVGADTLIGGTGNDIYIVDNALDVITELSAQGTDEAQSNVAYTIGANIENLTLTGSGNIAGTGNALANIITGNSGANTLSGGDGNDIIDGGAANDAMIGGLGNDTYYVNSASDVITELGGEGTDLVYSTSAAFTMSANVENLIIIGMTTNNANGNALDNIITGYTGNNTIYGYDGNDTIDGGLGNDNMQGGLGNDTYYVDSVSDLVTETGVGNDIVYSTVNFTIGANIEAITLIGSGNINAIGNASDNTLTGNSGNNTLTGNGGIDTMSGGLGDDIYVIDATDIVIENANQGNDTVQSALAYTLLANFENLTLTGTSAINGTGNSVDNILVGNSGINILTGNGGNDTLDGGTGNDTMIGGLGDDVYFMNVATDTITENASEGTDTVNTAFTYTLLTNFENLTLTGTAHLAGTGNDIANVITGNNGNNTLNGGLGNDTLQGGLGNDIYIVENALDAIIEDTSAGTDSVQSSAAAYTLSANIENMTLTGTANINGTGNDLNNSMTGNSGNNILDGGAGNDSMNGGAGDDIYVVDSVSDVVTDGNGQGTDVIRALVSFTLNGSYVENLTLIGADDIDATGNGLANILTGNSGNNAFTGGSGIDSFLGGNGNDTYTIDSVSEIVTENANEGTDTILFSATYTLGANIENLTLLGSANANGTGNGLENYLLGNSGNNALYGLGGNDIIDGGIGSDTMVGGTGNDIYYVSGINDVVVEAVGEGIDLIYSASSYSLDSNIENITLIGTANSTSAGNALNNIMIGNSGNNTLAAGDGNDIIDGGTGNDNMQGNNGNDTYYVDSTSDIVAEGAGLGNDLVYASASFTLWDDIETLILTGSADINATGSSGVEKLTGNSGANILTGNGGADRLEGKTGNDIYVIDNTDILVENAAEGIDTVQAAFTYTLLANFENLTLLGSGNISGTGSSVDNVIVGNSGDNTLTGLNGNDTLDGGSGADTMIGGLGDDIYYMNGTGDVITELSGQGTDLVYSTTNGDLDANVENLTLLGTTATIGTGNTLDNILTGSDGNNTLYGLDGNDTLDGGLGNDNMQGGLGNDIYVVDSLSDIVSEAASAGTDTVHTALAAYTLAANVENLELLGSDDIEGTGNTLVNILTGNTGNNTLDGAAGADTMVGGLGDDLYIIDNALDVITEAFGEGNDTAQSSVTYTMATGVENLVLTGSAALNGTGNSENNSLTGNNGVNTLTGNDGNDTLNGGIGADTLIGGAGNDIYIVDHVSEVVTETTNNGNDTVRSSVTHTLASNVENLILTGASTLNGTGNTLDNMLTGNDGNNSLYGLDGNDTLDGGLGTNTLYGGLGNDSFYIYGTNDTAVESASEGTDTVFSSATTYTLASNIENLTLAGAANIAGVGNALGNVLVGNTGNNTLTGNDGADTLVGGDGVDTLSGGNHDDALYGGAGIDALTGGAGSDQFVFESASAFASLDTISDFNVAQDDVIDISDLLTGYNPGVSDINDFVLLGVTGSNSSLMIDRDGVGTTYGVQSIATLTGVTGLNVDDLFNNGNLIV